MSRLALLSTAISLSLLATPVLAGTFTDYNGNDTVATTEQGNTAAVGTVGNPSYNRPMTRRHSDYRAAVRHGDRPSGDGNGQWMAVRPGLRPLPRLQRPLYVGVRIVDLI